MKEIVIKSTVTFSGGGKFVETYEATNLMPEAEQKLQQQFDAFKRLSAAANAASAGKPDANRQCTLSVTVDGTAMPDLVATLTRKEHEKIQKRTHHMGSEILDALHNR